MKKYNHSVTMEEIEDPDQDLLEDPEIMQLIANGDLQNNNNINTIRTARNNIRRGNILKLNIITIDGKKKTLKKTLTEIEKTYNDLHRDIGKLTTIFFDFHHNDFPIAIKERAGDLLEIILGRTGVGPNGLLVELRDLKHYLSVAINRIHSRRKSAGGNPNKKKNRKSKKELRRVH
jgi:hypothetical protein